MVPNVVKQDSFMAKVDLKDTYLTVPVCCLLAFQNESKEFLQFQTLSFGLCTAPYVFSKLTKPAIQFLRQIGIHIIIYLDKMLLVSPTERSLVQDLSTVIWHFSCLGFMVNTAKTTVVPFKELRVPGIHLEHQINDCRSFHSQNEGYSVGCGQDIAEPENWFQDSFPTFGQVSCNKASSTGGPITLSCSSALEDIYDETGTEGSCNSARSLERLDVVGQAVANASLLSHSSEGSNSNHRIQCFIERLGCQLQWIESRWSLDSNRGTMPYQLSQVKGSLPSGPEFSETTIENQYTAAARQPHSNSVFESHGGPSLIPLCCLALEIWEWCLAREMMIRAEY